MFPPSLVLLLLEIDDFVEQFTAEFLRFVLIQLTDLEQSRVAGLQQRKSMLFCSLLHST